MNTPAIDEREVARYLGYRGRTPDEKTAADIRRCIDTLRDVSTPSSVQATFPLTIEGDDLVFAGHRFTSAYFAKHLRGCTKLALFAATAGLAVDRLIARTQLTGIADAAILDAAATALIEAICDAVNEDIDREVRAQGLATRTRVSPGYGDFPLSAQGEILAILDAAKRCGITLTDGGMMMPSKSVTALVGIGARAEEDDSLGED